MNLEFFFGILGQILDGEYVILLLCKVTKKRMTPGNNRVVGKIGSMGEVWGKKLKALWGPHKLISTKQRLGVLMI